MYFYTLMYKSIPILVYVVNLLNASFVPQFPETVSRSASINPFESVYPQWL